MPFLFHSCMHSQPSPFGEWELAEMIVNCGIKVAVKIEWCVSSEHADWLIAVCHSDLGDTS